ncbi:hypothetical protein ACFQXA_27115 [Nocardiopsis composta]
MRLTILGGGGFRVPLVHRALLDDAARGDAVIDEVVLHDTDPSRVRAIEAVLAAQAERSLRCCRSAPSRTGGPRCAGPAWSSPRCGWAACPAGCSTSGWRWRPG